MNNTETKETATLCNCGCGLPVTSKYRQGHDARHAGIVARAAVAYADTHGVDYLNDELYESLPTPALKNKAKKAAARMVSKGAKRSERRANSVAKFGSKEGDRTGYVKIGRWDYPARKNARGEVVRNTKRDGSGTWSPADPEKFRAL